MRFPGIGGRLRPIRSSKFAVIALCSAPIAVVLLVGATGKTGAALVRDQRIALSPQLFSEVASGVVLIRTFNCGGTAIASGSGFLVGTTVVMTARHVVDPPGDPTHRACRVKVRAGGSWVSVKRSTYWTTGGDNGRAEDVETLKLSRPIDGYIFDIRTSPPKIGTNLAMLGHPLGNPVSLTQGRLFKRARVGGVPLIAVNLLGAEGASGAAMVDDQARVVGILQQGLGSKDILGERTSGVVVGIDLSTWWRGSAKRDLCRAYPNGGISGCDTSSPPPPPPPPPSTTTTTTTTPAPPPPSPAALPGQYCGFTEQGPGLCVTTSSDGRAVQAFQTSAIVDCTDGSRWTWTVSFSGRAIPLQADLSFSYNYSGPLTSSSGTVTNIQETEFINGKFTPNAMADGRLAITSISFDYQGQHYDCTQGAVGWHATKQ